MQGIVRVADPQDLRAVVGYAGGRSAAEKQAGEILDNARAEAEQEKKRQLDALHEQVMALSVQLASRILEREIKPEDHQKLMEEFLAEVK